MSLLELHDLACGYGGQPVVQQLNLQLQAGDIGCLLGASGCGKTTTLRAIAGFEAVHAGEIRLGGKTVARSGFTVAPEKRRIGMVFQDYALFPHLTVTDNVLFGIRQQAEARTLAAEMLELVNLQGLGQRFPHELSGGQQQRVALARALAPQPQLLLLDEPFSNLDVELRRRLSHEVRDILKHRGTSAILVTHDQEEAFAVSDQVGVFKQGRLEQWDTPYNLYHAPKTPYVASFIGQGFFIRGQQGQGQGVNTELGEVQAHADVAPGVAVDILLRPDSLLHAPDSPVRARVLGRVFQGASILYRLQLPSGAAVEALLPSQLQYALGSEIGIALRPGPLVSFAPSVSQ
ncbi:ABC transporter ATP-binding protein [Pseudomonas baltica]|uniref:ABC transporter ATP-binding protein n=1 Tax=Pseudomonas baltica TaxID=2762576 RepID=UPI0028A18E2E|nr:ABC transporter ATP-binding protein [Pseudomonas baltica]